jgi:benzoate transport
MSMDPMERLANSPMSRLQIAVVGITVALNGLDGFDVMSISYASPGIAAEWGIDRAALGIVLSMELIGMAIGSMLLGGVADRIGRRPTILGCLCMMAFGMIMTTTVSGLGMLSMWRVITGLGIGGMLAAINAVAAEFSSARRRHLSVSIMSIGYPVGSVLGGVVAAQLLKSNDWRSVFYFGAAATAVLIPVVLFIVPESVHWLARKQPAGALDAINRALTRMGRPKMDALPEIPAGLERQSPANIFGPAFLATTVIVTLAYFLHITTFYFIVKWVPKIVADFGFPASTAAGVLVWTNVGGALGGAVFGLLTQAYGVKGLTIAVLVLSTVAVTVFGRTAPDLQQLSMICAAAGFCTNAGIVGLYAIIAKAFPTHMRAFGTGFAIGLGRGGAVLAPIVAGFLFAAGYSLPTVALTMALGSSLAAAVLLFLKLEPELPVVVEREHGGVRSVPVGAPSRARS